MGQEYAQRKNTNVPCAQRIEGAFSWLHSLMVVDAFPAPKLLLSMVYNIPDDGPLLPSSSMASSVAEVHDRAGMLLFGSLVPIEKVWIELQQALQQF